MIKAIPVQHVYRYWDKVDNLLGKSLQHCEHDYTVSDIRKALDDREMQLWVYEVDHKVLAALVTSIISYPQRKVCVMMFMGGSRKNLWLKHEKEIEDWAVSQGCTDLELYGRIGWTRILKAWRQVGIKLRRKL